MKEESLGGYTRKSSEEEVKVDACWGWCDQILQKGKDGSWSVCGVLEETKEEARSADTPDAGTDMVEWLEGLGLRFGCQPEEFNDWLRSTETTISATNKQTYPTISRDVKLPFIQPKISAEHYMKGIQNCRDEIFAGNSYELTLINQFTATLPADSAPSSFDLYVQLRKRNPAPYSGYLHFPTVGNTILSSSPERLIRIDGEGRVEMKPIKGTRGRIRCVCARSTDCLGGGGPGCKARCEEMDRQVGEELRMDGKERAENLMVRCFDHY
jgi:para-aminobenzoate synthetase